MGRTTWNRSLNPILRETGGYTKTNVLLRLKEALIKEEYEVCRGIIAVARELGATNAEVRYLLEDPRREPS